MTIRIPRDIADRIRAQARREAPAECCGYLGTVDGTVRTIYPMTNVDGSPTHYTLDPQEQFDVVRMARDAGEEITAVYHSHPTSAARMSDEDLRLAYDHTILYIIYSIPDNHLRAYRVADHHVAEEWIVELFDGRDDDG